MIKCIATLITIARLYKNRLKLHFQSLAYWSTEHNYEASKGRQKL